MTRPTRVPRWLMALLSWRLGATEGEAVAGDLDELAEDRGPLATPWVVAHGLWLVIRWTLSEEVGMGGGGRVHGLAQDVRVAVRSMRRAPAVTFAIVATLALAIGATTAIFSVVDAVVLRTLPFEAADRLAIVHEVDPNGGALEPVSPLNLEDFRAQNTSFEALAGWTPERYALTGAGTPEQILVMRFTSGLFEEVLRVRPALGRFPDSDLEEDRGTIALTHGFWISRFGADEGVVGRTLTLDGEPYQVVGVLPAQLRFPDDDRVAAWMPLFRFPWEMQRWTRHTSVLGRLAPGASIEQAQAELGAVAARLSRESPRTNDGWGVEVRSAEELKGENRSLTLVFGAVGLVLLIACLNVANLFLVRATQRHAEWSVRRALGAARVRLGRQMLVESGVHALLGAVLGLGIAALALRVLLAVDPAELPRWNPIRLDGRVILFASAVTIGVTLLAAVLPVLRIGNSADADVARGGSRSTGSRSGLRGRSILSSLQVALAVVLSVGAGLLTASLLELRSEDPGFRTADVLTFTIELPGDRYASDDGSMADGFERIRDEVSGLPGVRGVGWVTALPMDPGGTDYDIEFFRVERPELTPADAPPSADFRVVSPGYLEALGIPLEAGRAFERGDREDGEPVVVVNRTLAERWFPGEDPLGQGIRLFENEGAAYRIVGVVGNVRHRGLDDASRPEIWVPYRQMTHDGMTLVVHSEGDPAGLVGAVRTAIDRVDPSLPMVDTRTMDERIDRTVAERRFGTALLSSFAVLGVILALVGVQGTLAYAVSRRRREIGVRMAIGADRGSVVRTVLRGGLGVIGVGWVLGLVTALALAGTIRSLLYGVAPTDPRTLGTVSALILAVGLVACAVPALRASRVDPIEALRKD